MIGIVTGAPAETPALPAPGPILPQCSISAHRRDLPPPAPCPRSQDTGHRAQVEPKSAQVVADPAQVRVALALARVQSRLALVGAPRAAQPSPVDHQRRRRPIAAGDLTIGRSNARAIQRAGDSTSDRFDAGAFERQRDSTLDRFDAGAFERGSAQTDSTSDRFDARPFERQSVPTRRRERAQAPRCPSWPLTKRVLRLKRR